MNQTARRKGTFEPGNQLSKGKAKPPTPLQTRRGRFLTQQLIARLRDKVRDPTTGDEREAMAVMIDALVANAMGGDQQAIAFCFDRAEGPVPKEVNVNMTMVLREKLKYLTDEQLEMYERVCEMFRSIELVEQEDGTYKPAPGTSAVARR